MNAVVKLLRERAPAEAGRYSDDDLTLLAGDTFRAEGVFDLEDAYPDFRDQYLRLRAARAPGAGAEGWAGLKVGVLDRLPQAAYGLGAAITGGVGLERAEGWLLEQAQRNAQEAAERAPAPRAVERFEDIRVGGPTEQAARFFRWAVPTFTENAPSMVPVVGAGLVGSLAGPPGTVASLAGAAGAAGLTSVGMEAGSQFADLGTREGVDRGKAREAALLYGSAAGAVDAIGAVIPVLRLTPAGKALTTKLGASAVSRIAADVLDRGGLRGALATAGAQGLSEGATEVVQEAINMAGEEYATGQPIPAEEYRSRLLNAAAAGGLVGAGMGGALGVRGARADTQPIVEDESESEGEREGAARPAPRLLLPPTRDDELGPDADEIARFEDEGGAQAQGRDVVPETPVIELPPSTLSAELPAAQPTTTEVPSERQEDAGQEGQGLQVAPPVDLRTDMVKASRVIPLVSNWKPARIARSGSNSEDVDAGRYAVALEKDGTVHVRNVYARKDGAVFVENADDLLPAKGRRGPGRGLEALKAAGYVVVEPPFQLSRVSGNLRASLPLGQWQEMRAAAGRVEQGLAAAIAEGRADEAGAVLLNMASPESAAAIEYLRDAALAEAPELSPRQLMYGLLAPIESLREAIKRVGAIEGEKRGTDASLLSEKDDLVLGLFKPDDFAKFARFVASGAPSSKMPGLTKADAMLLRRVARGEGATLSEAKAGLAAWARAMAELGAQRQSGVFTQAGTKAKIDEKTAAEPAVAAEGPPARLTEYLTDAFVAITASIPGKPSLEKFKAAYATFAREHLADVKRLNREGDIVGNLEALYEAWTKADTATQFVRRATQRSGDRGTGGRAGEAASGRSGRGDAGGAAPTLQPGIPASLQERLSRPSDSGPAAAGAAARATGEAVRRAFGRVTSLLAAAGVDVRVVRGSAAGGVFDGERMVTLVLKDVLEPSAIDLRVAVHEAVHVLFASVPADMRFRIENGVLHWFERMPEDMRATIDEGNLSIRDARSVQEWLEERLAVMLERSAVPEARGVAAAIWAWMKEVYLRVAGAIAEALGRGTSAEDLSLRWFMQRFERMLAGEIPDGFIETAGGPLLDLKAQALRLLGMRPESVRPGGIDMLAPDSPEAIEFNLHASRYAGGRPESEWDRVPTGSEFFRVKAALAADAAPVVRSVLRSQLNRDPLAAARRGLGYMRINFPEQVSSPLLGTNVRLIHPEPRGPRELNDYERRIYHFMTQGANPGAFMPRVPDGDKADGLNHIVDTLENGQALLRQPDGTRLIVRRYANGRLHAVVVGGSARGAYVDTQFWVGNTATLRSAVIEKKREALPRRGHGALSEDPSAPRPDPRVVESGDAESRNSTSQAPLPDGPAPVPDYLSSSPDGRGSQERRSRPAQPEPLGDRDNLANAIHLNVAAINHALDTEAAIAEELAKTGTLAGAAQARGLGLIGMFRELFGLSDPDALKRRALERVDPATGEAVAGVNDGQRFEHFRSKANSDRARILAYDAAWRLKAQVSKGGREAKAQAQEMRRQIEHRQERLTRALKDYLNADGLAAEIGRGLRRMLAAERWTADRANRKLGSVEQLLRELDPEVARSAERLGEYQAVFTRVFKQAMGLERRRLFEALDALVAEANMDLDRPIGEIRLALAEKQAAIGSPELARLTGNTREANALLALFVAYGRANTRVLADIERRRVRTAEERNRLQHELEALATTRADVNEAIRRLPKAARLEERVKAAYQAERARLRALEARAREAEIKVEMAAAALPVIKRQVEGLSRAINLMPRESFGDGMEYVVPPSPDAPGGTLRDEANIHRVSLNAEGAVTEQATLKRHLEAMTLWLGAREARARQGDAAALDADYFGLKAQRDAIAKSGFFEAANRKLDTTVMTMSMQPVGRIAEGYGTASGRRIAQRMKRFAAILSIYRAETEKRGQRNDRLRARAMDVLNRGVARADRLKLDDYFRMFVEPAALGRIEKERGLLEQFDERSEVERIKARIWQKILNDWLADPATAPYVRGKEAAVYKAVREHVDELAETSAWFHAQNTKYGLGVSDPRLIAERLDGKTTEGIRDSLPQGIQTFSVRTSQKLRTMYDAMAKGSTSWQAFDAAAQRAVERYLAGDRNGAQRELAPFFGTPAAWYDFVGQLAQTHPYAMFDAPTGPDGAVRGEADPALVAEAYRQTQAGDVIAFIETLHEIQGGETAPGLYVEQMLKEFGNWWRQVHAIMADHEPGITGRRDGFLKMIPGMMIDSRILERWPTGWREMVAFDAQTNHNLATRLAAQVAFGRDQEGLHADYETLVKEVEAMVARLEAIEAEEQRRGGTARQIEARVVRRLGKAEHARLMRARRLKPELGHAANMLHDYFQSKHTDLGAMRWTTALVHTLSNMLLQQPGSALMQLSELFSPLITEGLSRDTVRQVLRAWKYFGEDEAGSLTQAVGLKLWEESRQSRNFNALGLGDPAAHRKYIEMTEDGVRSDIFADMGRRNEAADIGVGTRVLRRIPKLLEVPLNLRGAEARYTVTRPFAMFTQTMLQSNRANTLAMWDRVESLVAEGLRFFAENPIKAADPGYRLTATDLGLKGLRARTFEMLAARMAEGYDLELTDLVRQAQARVQAEQIRGNENQLLDERTRQMLHGLVINEISSEGNLATMSPRAFTQGFLRLMLPLWGWPIRRGMQVARMVRGLDETGRFRVAALGNAMLALAVATGVGMGYSVLLDEYHERVLRKARNLRSAKNLLDAPNAYEVLMTVLEATNRVGTFGVLGDVANGLTNMAAGEGDNRTFSLDQRVVAVNSLMSLSRGLSSLVAQGGEADYANVVRPVLQALGAGGMMQYMQIANNAFDLGNAESRVTARINAQNYLRVAGRMTGLEVRKAAGGHAMPNEMTPAMNRMVLAAYAGDRALFQEAWRAAVARAREAGKQDPAGFVRDSFRARHPLRTVFRSIRDSEYRDLLEAMDERGRQDVQEAVANFNRFGAMLGISPYLGSVVKQKSGAGGTASDLDLRGLTVPTLGSARIF